MASFPSSPRELPLVARYATPAVRSASTEEQSVCPTMFTDLVRLALTPLRRSRVVGIRKAAGLLDHDPEHGIPGTAAPAAIRDVRSSHHRFASTLGCGPNPKQGRVNMDLEAPEADTRLDVRRPWPSGDASANMIYSEHFFEHLEYPDEVRFFLQGALRLLRPGGLLSTGVPDAEPILGAYASRSETGFETDPRWQPEWCGTALHSVDCHRTDWLWCGAAGPL